MPLGESEFTTTSSTYWFGEEWDFVKEFDWFVVSAYFAENGYDPTYIRTSLMIDGLVRGKLISGELPSDWTNRQILDLDRIIADFENCHEFVETLNIRTCKFHFDVGAIGFPSLMDIRREMEKAGD